MSIAKAAFSCQLSLSRYIASTEPTAVDAQRVGIGALPIVTLRQEWEHCQQMLKMAGAGENNYMIFIYLQVQKSPHPGSIPTGKRRRWLLWKRFLGTCQPSVKQQKSHLRACCAVYLKIDNDGRSSLNFVTSKTRVSPVGKPQTIPRLELLSALQLLQCSHAVLLHMKR